MNKIKAIITACLMIGLAGLTFTPAAFGADESISVTMDPSVDAAIDLNVTDWSVDGLNTTASLDVQINNTGSVNVEVTTDANTTTEEGAWSAFAGDITADSLDTLYNHADHNTYVMAIGGYTNIANGTAYTISSDLPASGQTNNWTGVTYSINMPTSTSTTTVQHFNINITATAN